MRTRPLQCLGPEFTRQERLAPLIERRNVQSREIPCCLDMCTLRPILCRRKLRKRAPTVNYSTLVIDPVTAIVRWKATLRISREYGTQWSKDSGSAQLRNRSLQQHPCRHNVSPKNSRCMKTPLYLCLLSLHQLITH